MESGKQKNETILIVEGEPKLAALLQDYLKDAGYEATCLSDGRKVVPRVRAKQPDLILLNLILPGRDGLDICQEIRSFSDVPVIMVTMRIEEIDRLLGLEIGADDYICKPFTGREVVARIRTILRRTRRSTQSLASYGLILDQERYQACLDGHILELTPVEFRLLKILAESPGQVFSRKQLLNHLYDVDNRVVTDRAFDSHVKNLRSKLEAIRPVQDLIHSIYGVGYRLDL